MLVRTLRNGLWLLISTLLTSATLAQSDRGTITGAISDPAGAVVASAPVQVRNVDNGSVYPVGSSATGNYTVQVPAGNYEMVVAVAGFKRYVRQNIAVPVAQTLRIDVGLEVGSNAESVTVTEAAPLLKTESGELSHNVATDTLNNLPVLGIGAGNAGGTGIRSVYSVLNMLPGTNWLPNSSLRVNGMESNSAALRVEGQDATNSITLSNTTQNQPSVEATQEVAIQTSNFAAEFGQAGGGLFNLTMKSGSNQFHGSAYDYFVNEALNASQPFVNARARQRRSDFGFSIGGPVWIPKIYNGHDRTFFFFNFEQYRETTITNNVPVTVPTTAYRNGDFRQALTGRNIGTDGLGRALFENTIYDPATDRLVGGVRYRDPFPSNTIPIAQIDPVVAKVEALIPAATSTGLVNNYLPSFSNRRVSQIPSVKIDHSLSSTLKLSGYWSRTQTDSPSNTSLPFPLGSSVGSHVKTDTIRVNIDYTIRPTLLLHLGGGLVHANSDPQVPFYDPLKELGFKGANADMFPYLTTLTASQGGVLSLGPASNFAIKNVKPTATATLTWVRNSHTYKAGGEMIVSGFPSLSKTYSPGYIQFAPTQTGLPSLLGATLPSTVGFPYASFFLGMTDSGYDSVPAMQRLGNHSLAWFVQDSWKVTRKLTVDYGLRYDFQTYLREHNGYMLNVSPGTPNPSAGGQPGGIIFEATCKCQFANNYPWAYGPRFGIAYQITPKTVLRIGGGISYAKTSNEGSKASNTGSVKPFRYGAYGDAPFLMRDGLPYIIKYPDFDPGQQPLPGVVSNPTNYMDNSAGRPARIFQWSIGLQRELSKDLVVEASYVANRGNWWAAQTMSTTAANPIPISRLTANGLSLDNAADRSLLLAPVNSSLAASRGFGNPPYPGFPTGLTVAQALRPMPEYTTVVNTWNALGNTWYDALQAKVTKRFSHGLDFVVSYTRAKNLALGAEDNNNYTASAAPFINDVFNRMNNKTFSGYDQPNQMVFAGNYTTPKIKLGGAGTFSKALSFAARDWTWGGVLRYSSGMPLRLPTATTGLNTLIFQNTLVERVPGVEPFTADLNCHCFDPNKTFVLNPAAWVNPQVGKFAASSAYYDDYRQQRRPRESMSLARNFRFGEGKMNLMIRAEFSNIFNRTQMNDPTSTNAFATQTKDRVTGQNSAGFGWINTASVDSPARQGTLVARFSF